MKTLVVRGTSIFVIPLGLALFSAIFNAAVYAQSQELPNSNTQQSDSNSIVCNSIPAAKPTGGATSIRLKVLQQCYKNTPRGTIQSATVSCELPPARPTGGATLTRLQILQECDRKMSQGSR